MLGLRVPAMYSSFQLLWEARARIGSAWCSVLEAPLPPAPRPPQKNLAGGGRCHSSSGCLLQLLTLIPALCILPIQLDGVGSVIIMNLIFACFSLANRLEDRASDGMALKMLYGERGRDAVTATRVGGRQSIKAAGWLGGPAGLLMGGWAAVVSSPHGQASCTHPAPTTSKQPRASGALLHQAVCANAHFIQRPINVLICAGARRQAHGGGVHRPADGGEAETVNRPDCALHPCVRSS